MSRPESSVLEDGRIYCWEKSPMTFKTCSENSMYMCISLRIFLSPLRSVTLRSCYFDLENVRQGERNERR